MAFRDVGAAWRTDLETVKNTTQRFYIDFRQSYYPPQTDTTTYTAVATDERGGEFNATGGYASYLLAMPDEGTLSARVLPTFTFNTGSDQPLLSWYVSATVYFTILYRAVDDKYAVVWRDGGTERELASAAYVDNPTLQAWTDIAVVWDISAQTGELYINGTSVDSSWSAAPDAKTSDLPILELRAENATAGGYEINHVRFFNGTEAADADVANDFKDVEEEETFWPLEDCALGYTRTNITRHVASYGYHAEAEKPEDASIAANKLRLQLWSQVGEFADDQYAAWDPASDVFNGTSGQAYMQQRCPVYAEHWYGGDFEPFFAGRIDENRFKRKSAIDGITTVTVSAEDFAREMATTKAPDAVAWEDKKLSDATEADSLVHLVTRQASQRTVYNLASNSSFENATIANSWTVAGTGATFSRVAGGLFGSWQGDLVYGSAACEVAQTITFTSDRKLNVGETYTFSIYLKSAGACGDLLLLEERDSVGLHDSSSGAWTRAGGEGWARFSVSHTITDSTSDRLRIVVELDDNVTLSLDGVMLVYGGTAYNWFVLNDNDGAAGVESADDADSSAYDQIGFDADAVNITHPYAILMENSNAWDAAQDIADATVASYMGLGKSGALKFRSPFKTGYSDPSPLLTVTDPGAINTDVDGTVANHIIVYGDKITKDTRRRLVWTAEQAGIVTADPWDDSIANSDYWPDRTDYPGGYWAQYGNVVAEKQILEWTNEYDVTFRTEITRRRAPTESEQQAVIGASSLVLTHKAYEFIALSHTNPVTLTQNVFDTTTKADQARIEFLNATGDTAYIAAAGIFGKLVTRQAEYFVNDNINEGSVYRDGESKFEVGNRYIITQAQVNQIADYWAKYFRGNKHEYTATFSGERLYFEPGEWYTLDVGAAGTRENINSTVRCLSVKVDKRANSIGRTVVRFQEIEANWTYDSNAVARAIASGQITQLGGRAVTVASSTYIGPADTYCDGTADEVEIQEAIDHVSGLGGGVVQLTDGTYVIAAAIIMHSNVILRGVGASTILEKNVNDYCIEAVGSDGSEVTDIVIESLKVTRNSADTNSIALVYGSYADRLFLRFCWVENSALNGVEIANCDDFMMQNCYLTDNNAVGLQATTSNRGTVGNSYLRGGQINFGYSLLSSGNDWNISSNVFGESWGGAMILSGDRIRVIGNQVVNNYDRCYIGAGNPTSPGIYITGDDNRISSNTLIDNGNFVDNGDCEHVTYGPQNVGEVTTDSYLTPTGNPPTFARSSVQAYRGTYSRLFTFNGTDGGDEAAWWVDNNTTTDMHDYQIGQQYTMSAWVYVPSSGGVAIGEVALRIDQYYSATWNETASANPTGTDAWEKLTVSATINASATGVRVGLVVDSTASATETVYIDDVLVNPTGLENYHNQHYYEA